MVCHAQLQVIVPERILCIENFFTPGECAQYIQRSESIGFDAASVTSKTGQAMLPEVHNNFRVNLADAALAAKLWQRLAPYAPSPLFKRTAIGLNERWRFYRYEAGQTFKSHYDGSVKRTNGEKSMVTFMVYLNQDCIGGEIRFPAHANQAAHQIVLRAGMALLCLHTLLHEGVPVLSGRKYVLRSDVMYSAPL